MSNGTSRSRLITWEDPLPSAEASRHMSGLDYMRALANGTLPSPPISQLMGMSFGDVDAGRIVFTVEPDEYHYNPIATVHGGLAATILDSAMSCAVHTMLPVGVGYTTLEMKVNFVRSITADTGRLRCIGRVIHMGRRIATAEGSLLDANDKLYAHGTATCIILS